MLIYKVLIIIEESEKKKGKVLLFGVIGYR